MNRSVRFLSTFQVCVVLFTLVVGICTFVSLRDEYPLWRALWVLRISGYGALGLLFVALSVTPLLRIAGWCGFSLRRDWLVSLRRHAGITAASLGLLHALFALFTYLENSWPILLKWPFTRSGLLALLVLVLLLVTSFPRLVQLLRIKVWKQLHRLAYVAAFFVLQHLFLAPFSSRWWALLLVGVFVLLITVRLTPRRVRSARPSGTP